MLSAPFIDGSPYLFYTKNICHLCNLFAPIKTIVNSFQNLTLPHDLKEDMAFFLLTETNLPHDFKEDYPNGNLILREDYQKSFKKEVRWNDIKSFLKTESIREVYPSYSNGEKNRYVCRPSRQNGVHDGFDRRKQAVKMADVFGIEKVWAAIYEGSRQHGDFGSKKSNWT